MTHDFLLEATIKESKFGELTKGDTVFVIEVHGALFTSRDTKSEKRECVRLKEPKYYLCKSICDEGFEIDWSKFIYVIDKKHLKFKREQV